MKVSGLDVHKGTIFCAIYDGENQGELQEYPAFYESMRTTADSLGLEGVNRMAIESTGIYWKPVWNILAEVGSGLMLVHPYLIKQIPGRRRDGKDAE